MIEKTMDTGNNACSIIYTEVNSDLINTNVIYRKAKVTRMMHTGITKYLIDYLIRIQQEGFW